MTREEFIRRIAENSFECNGCFVKAIRYGVFVVLSVLLFSSCATKTKIEYRDRIVDRYITKEVHDTLIDKTTDSVYVKVYVKGDTVFSEKYKEKTRWRDRIVERHDTCWRDSVVTEYKKDVVEVVKIPKIYRIALLFSIICCIFASIKLVRWLKTF